MRQAADCSEIVPDRDNLIARWVCNGLHTDTVWLQNYRVYGVMRNAKIIAGLIFHNLRYGQDVWWTIYAEDARWCNRRIVSAFMREAFEVCGCRRINLLVDADNEKCLKFVLRLGFKIEGKLRQFREDGKDCLVLGLLKSENKF